jgi:putative toxin-antitoxin system antitoxin component (TIGR02293 family)
MARDIKNTGTAIPAPPKTVVKRGPKVTARSRATRGGARAGTGASAKLSFSYSASDDKDMLAIIELVREGISYQDFLKILADIPFTLSEWAGYLQLSERTMQRNQKENKPFQPIQSERIVELSMLYRYGVEVFGDKGSFDVWLSSKSLALGGRSPKDLLDTKFGISMVKDELGRIEHGILA